MRLEGKITSRVFASILKSHVLVLRAAPALRKFPLDVPVRILGFAGLAMQAVREVHADLLLLLDPLIDLRGAEPGAGAVELRLALVETGRPVLDRDVARLVLLVHGSGKEHVGQLVEHQGVLGER